MKKETFYTYLIFIILTEITGILSALFVQSGLAGFNDLSKPVITPPAFIFPIVWTILFALIGTATAMIYLKPESTERTQSLLLYVLQLFVNFFWSILFFGLHAYGLSLIWLIILVVLIILMIRTYKTIDLQAAYLLIPYLLWVLFAGILNLLVWIMN